MKFDVQGELVVMATIFSWRGPLDYLSAALYAVLDHTLRQHWGLLFESEYFRRGLGVEAAEA